MKAVIIMGDGEVRESLLALARETGLEKEISVVTEETTIAVHTREKLEEAYRALAAMATRLTNQKDKKQKYFNTKRRMYARFRTTPRFRR